MPTPRARASAAAATALATWCRPDRPSWTRTGVVATPPDFSCRVNAQRPSASASTAAAQIASGASGSASTLVAITRARGAVPHRPDQRVVDGQHRGPVGRQRLDDLPLGDRDLLLAAELAHVRGAHVEHRGHLGRSDPCTGTRCGRRRERPSPPPGTGSPARSGRPSTARPSSLLRLPTGATVGSGRLEHLGQQVLGRGLARRTGDRHHLSPPATARSTWSRASRPAASSGSSTTRHGPPPRAPVARSGPPRRRRANAVATYAWPSTCSPGRARNRLSSPTWRESTARPVTTTSSAGVRGSRRGVRTPYVGAEQRRQLPHRHRDHRPTALHGCRRGAARPRPRGRRPRRRRAAPGRPPPGPARAPCPARPRCRRDPTRTGRRRSRRAASPPSITVTARPLRSASAWAPASTWARIAAGSSLRGLSSVTTTSSAAAAAAAPIGARFSGSRSPPQPSTTMRRWPARPASTALTAWGVCAKSTNTVAAPAPRSTRCIRPGTSGVGEPGGRTGRGRRRPGRPWRARSARCGR